MDEQRLNSSNGSPPSVDHHTIIWICPSVRLLPIYSADFRPIAAKLGTKVGDGTPQELRALVTMETEPLPWYLTKTALWL